PVFDLRGRQVELPAGLGHRRFPPDDLQYQRRLAARSPSLDLFFHHCTHGCLLKRLHLSRKLLGHYTTANTDADRERLTLERMRQHGIVLGLVSGPDAAMASMRKGGGEDRIWAGAFLDDGRTPLPPAEGLREAIANGVLKVVGEIGARCERL